MKSFENVNSLKCVEEFLPSIWGYRWHILLIEKLRLTGLPWAGGCGCWVGDTFLWTKCCLIMDNSGDVECAGGWGWQSNNITIFHPQFPHPSTLSLRVPIRLSVPGVSGPVFMDWSKYPIYYDNPPPSPAHTVASSPGLADTQMEGFIS